MEREFWRISLQQQAITQFPRIKRVSHPNRCESRFRNVNFAVLLLANTQRRGCAITGNKKL